MGGRDSPAIKRKDEAVLCPLESWCGSTGFNRSKQGGNGTRVTFVGARRSPEACQLAWSST